MTRCAPATAPAAAKLFPGRVPNPTFAVYAARVRARTSLRIVGVQLRTGSADTSADENLIQLQRQLLEHFQRSNVHRLLAYVDTLRLRYQIESLHLATPGAEIRVTVHRDGRLQVDPAHRYAEVHAKLTDCLPS